jgi:hypothetical protein
MGDRTREADESRTEPSRTLSSEAHVQWQEENAVGELGLDRYADHGPAEAAWLAYCAKNAPPLTDEGWRALGRVVGARLTAE